MPINNQLCDELHANPSESRRHVRQFSITRKLLATPGFLALLATTSQAEAQQYYYQPPPSYYQNDTATGAVVGGALGAVTGGRSSAAKITAAAEPLSERASGALRAG